MKQVAAEREEGQLMESVAHIRNKAVLLINFNLLI